MKYSTDTWTINVPNDWSVDESEDIISFYSGDETRSLHVSDYFKDQGDVALEDIHELAEVDQFETTNLPFLNGVKHQLQNGDEQVTSWWLYIKNHLLFAEYVCLTDQYEALSMEIEELVYSLRSFSG